MLDETASRIASALKEKPGAALEDVARLANARVMDVVRNLLEGEAICVSGRHFVDAMKDMTGWGEITMIVNTGDVIMEAKAPLPDGSLGHGYYNLHGKPIGGHLKADACGLIAFVSRKFMGKATHSVQFYNVRGDCMFKIYLGRGPEGDFLPGQVDAFLTLRDRLTDT